MKELEIDLETRSDIDLSKCGVYKYVESPYFDILLFGYAVDGGAVQVIDLANGETIPKKILKALVDDRVIKRSHNVNFERVCLSKYLYKYYPQIFESYSISEDCVGAFLNPINWHCTMIHSRYLGMPSSLAEIGSLLKLEEQKMTEGKALIKYFCVPYKIDNGSPKFHCPSDAPDKWDLFKSYNKRDVETELAIDLKLRKFPVPDSLWEEFYLDQEINDRGIQLDMDFVSCAITADEQSRTELTARLKELTGLENPNSVAQMKQWLADNGVETESLGKADVQELLKAGGLSPEIEEVLLLRQQSAKSSVKKYTAMQNAVGEDGRARGMFFFYGANRTGRFAGRLIQLQNLPQNHITDLAEARALVKSGDFGALELLYDNIPDTLSQLVRTAFVPKQGMKFIVADFSAIEARVIAWLAGEQWRMNAFANGEDIYCASASKMFGVPVVKHGVNGHLRQKGKVAELACIAEGQLVLTNHGLIPIEKVSLNDRLWDGENWVSHDGVVYRGEREVITYDGLTATPDHLVWVEGQSKPIQFGIAATSGTHLVQTGNGGRAVRLGKNYQSGEMLEQDNESLSCPDKMSRLWLNSMAGLRKFKKRKIERVSVLFTATTNSIVVRQKIDSRKAKVRKSKRCRISQLWCKGHKIQVLKCNRGGIVSYQILWTSHKRNGDRQNQQQRRLCSRQYPVCYSFSEQLQQTHNSAFQIRPTILGIFLQYRNSQTFKRNDTGRNYSGCGECCQRETQELETHIRKARLYDIRNAGRHHRFTVSGKLVHNCGYGGSVGAMKAMGGSDLGLSDEELKQIVTDWRTASPNIVKLWWDVDNAVKKAVRKKEITATHGLQFSYQSGILFIRLPSGRSLAYVKPRIEENAFGGESITYEGVGATKKWERIESYGPKFVENCLAKGTLVITDCGLIPIEKITDDMKIWDGVEWVSHDGLIVQGRKDTINVDGIRMTPEHKILTKKGWIECGKAEGFNWSDVSLPDRSSKGRGQQAGENAVALQMCLWESDCCFSKKSKSGEIPTKILWVHEKRINQQGKYNAWNEPSSCLGCLAFDETALYRLESSCISQLWWQRDFCVSALDGKFRELLVGYGHNVAERTGHRQDRQQQGVQPRKLSLGNQKAEQQKQTKQSNGNNLIRKDDTLGTFRKDWDWSNNTTLSPESWMESRIVIDRTRFQEYVYDIRNCGSRHRFAVWNGKRACIVSNCVQGIARDLLMNSMMTLRSCFIVAHIHDELIIEADKRMSLEVLCEQMAKVPDWADGLLLRADGYECEFYKKD
jgi:DNA polymerase